MVRPIFIAILMCACSSVFAQTTICTITKPKFQFKAISWNAADKTAKLTLPGSGVYAGQLLRVQKHDYAMNKFNLYFKADAKYFADEIELIVYPVEPGKYSATGANYQVVNEVRYLHSTISVFPVECNTH